MTRFSFSIAATDGAARAGTVAMQRGEIRTPAFMPVGTAATVKAMKPQDVRASGADIILGNTYHLMLLSELTKVTEEGVSFASHLDGTRHMMSPERSIEVQRLLGSDIVMAF